MPSPRPSEGRVALLGIAQRSVRVKILENIKTQKDDKALNGNVKSLGDWLKVKRIDKNLTPHHVAEKMGIASGLVILWETGISLPDSQQMTDLAATLGFDIKDAKADALTRGFDAKSYP